MDIEGKKERKWTGKKGKSNWTIDIDIDMTKNSKTKKEIKNV